ncbi:uncharacterized protein LOC129730120 [Wyeomyia smithii]|uniref:uncharacterized protein LOC129730120 n=1 Tax=Wyeomyia smithii TaxID=174621 RepID=UPI002467D942|nr:uncharacterized protein LOC129730120 [Wyeomyia smithii]
MNVSEIESAGLDAASTTFYTDDEQSLSHRMIVYVYRVSGIVSVRQLPFWEEFCAVNPDIEMSVQDLRAVFFTDVINNLEHYEFMNYEVAQYLNPPFNQYRLDSLEFGDLTEGDDFLLDVPNCAAAGNLSFEDMAQYVIAPLTVSHKLPVIPLHLETIPRSESSMSQGDLRELFFLILSELVLAKEEVQKSRLTVADIQDPVLNLSEIGISLQSRLKPGMIAFDLLNDSETEHCDDSHDDQLVPSAEASPRPEYSIKRSRSVGDSGIVLSPTKRSRVIPSDIRKHRLRRLFSAPADSMM